ncbi:hypothetical protein ERO13_A08G155750v2 [Gossypium hirsutum]|uniref:RING-type E3 ubiquitin transferase n=2 Tax=Gossypium TaxID=3633 RepID=A0A2P5YKJ2_GOSBA|nr:hypothetical protein ERO13_A08G155750v2 [Gossypium hirsutum]PPS16093.1 hypothetical protein GOBAR_AA04471 [Gossypium barbadense]TYJ23180.1 hypothetical protein E1A91_A08G173200v1 [Gossypium mustelinum]
MVITARFCTTSSPRIERVWLWRQRWWWECVPNAKTRICNKWELTGYCPFGNRAGAYLCSYFLKNVLAIWNYGRNPSAATAATEGGADMSDGLDPELIQAFPTFYYSSVKDFCPQKYSLECAICLAEFSDGDMLRFLTICCHVFHQECIDHWLESHKTCPVCRQELDVTSKSIVNVSSLQDSVRIEVSEDINNKVNGVEDAQCSLNSKEQHDKKHEVIERYLRSHSTGHSITIEEEEDKHTLRLPDNVRIKIARRHKSEGSYIAFGEFTSCEET